MSYIGNGPEVNAFTIGVERFNGTGACTEFTLTRDIDDAKAIEVIVNGVQQDPDNSYSVTNGLITFSEAPSSGTDNIIVTYRAPVVVTFNQVTPSQLQANSVTETALASNSVTTTKIADNSIFGNKIGLSSISGNQIGLFAVSGNQIGTGAISANNFAGGGITSNVLSSNLQISISRVTETINTVTSGVSGNYNIHIANSTIYYFTSNTTGNVTFNLRANTQNTLDSIVSTGQTASVTIFLKQGATRYRANVYIDNVLQTAYWLGNSQPSFLLSQNESFDVYNFSVLKTAANSYAVFASNSQFALALGQGINGVGQ